MIALLLSYQSPSTDPNEIWIWSFFGIFYPVILIANLFMMLAWILVDYKYIFLSFLIILIGWEHLTGFINISPKSKDLEGIGIVSYNVGSGYNFRDKDSERQALKTKLFKNYLTILDNQDVICLQESNKFVIDIYKSKYPKYQFLQIENKGVVIFSKYTIVNSGSIDFGTKTNSCIYADLNTPEGIIRVYNLHLQSNKISKDAAMVLDSPELDEPETWSSVKSILEKYKTACQKRSVQAKKVKNHADASPYPVIIVGDVNDPPTSFSYQTLSTNFKDAYRERGSGLGTTYGGSIPMLRIDYILTDASFEVLEYKCRKEKFSDHFSVFARVKL